MELPVLHNGGESFAIASEDGDVVEWVAVDEQQVSGGAFANAAEFPGMADKFGVYSASGT